MMDDNEALQIFHTVRFFLFGFNPTLKNQVRLKLLEGGGVELSRYGPECTHLIVDNVVYDDPLCVAARTDGKIVVTSLWVIHSCDLGMLVAETPIIYRPVRDLNGIPGAKSFVICLTGYQRQDRDDIMTMVELMGATFSKALVASKITHLVCFKFEGEKYELAKKIEKIRLVNHCWLDDCLRAWEILPEVDYNKSSYELEIMEGEAKDSEEEREQVPTEPHSGRKIQSPQNLRIERSPHQPALLDSEILSNKKCSDASVVLEGPDDCNDMPSVTKNNAATSCSTSGLDGIRNKYPDLPNALDTYTIGEESGFPINHYATAITPEKVKNNLASTLGTADKSPSSPSTRSNSKRSPSKVGPLPATITPEKAKSNLVSTSITAEKLPLSQSRISTSRRSPSKVGLPVCSAQRKINQVSTLTEVKSTFNVSDGFNLSLSIEEPSETGSAIAKTPVVSHLEHCIANELPDKRTGTVSGRSGKSQKKSDDLAASARSLHSGGPSETVRRFSASKATSCTDNQHDLDDPSHGELIKGISNSSGLDDTNLCNEVGPNSNPTQGRKKILARKVLGSSSRFGKWSTMNKKGSIQSRSSSGGKLEEDYDHERVKLLNASAGKNVTVTIQAGNIQESRSGSITKARPQDDETETPEDEADVFYVASHKDELDPMTSEIEISASGGANNNDEAMGANELMTTEKENSKCAEVRSATVEMNEKEHTTTERMDKGRKRPFSKTKEHSKGKKDAINGDTQEKKPKKANDGKTKKKGKNPLTTSGREKGADQLVGMNEAVTDDKENKCDNAVCTEKLFMENTTTEAMGRPRKRPLTKLKSHQNMMEAETKWKTREDVLKVVVSNEQTEKGERNSSTNSGQSTISAQENSLSSLQMEKESSPIMFPDKGGKRHSGKASSKSKEKPALTELKGVASNIAGRLAKHSMKNKEPMCFLVSGHKIQRKEFQQVIRHLRGKVCRDSHYWSYQATHLILPDPIRRTEKFFAAAASGRWILKTDYLTACNEAGKFLGENPYEWHKNSLTVDGSINLVAPQKWRLVRERTGHGAFYGLRIIVYGECIAPPLDTLKRAVKAGDGMILATSPPYTRFLESGVDLAIVSPGMPRVDVWIQEFLRHEIPCVLADYLVDYVCKPGYSLDKHVQFGTHSWAEKSLKNLVSRMEEIVEDQAFQEDTSSESDIACQICESRDRGEVMLICGDESGLSGCGTGIHIDCCDPPLSEVPLEDWFCPKCRTTEKIPTTKKPRGKRG